MGGRPATVSDENILREIAHVRGPATFSTELAPKLDLSQQGVYNRLSDLADDGLVDTKKVGNCRIYWLTARGRHRLAEG